MEFYVNEDQTRLATVTYRVETFYTPLAVGTGIFAALFMLGPCVVRRGEDQPDIRFCIRLAIVCMWLFWATVYVSQMNPLVGPVVKNTTLAWIAYTWGNQAKTVPTTSSTTTGSTSTTTTTTTPSTTLSTASSVIPSTTSSLTPRTVAQEKSPAVTTTISQTTTKSSTTTTTRPQRENIKTRMSPSLIHCSYEIKNFTSATRLNFDVRAKENAHIAVSDSPNMNVNGIILSLGTENNRASAITNIISYKVNEKSFVRTDYILNEAEYRGFWMTWVDGKMSAGYKDDDTPFISWQDRDRVPGHYVGLCTTMPADGSWYIEVI